MNNDPRGTLIQQGNILRVDNALIEDVFTTSNSTGFIVISYADNSPNQTPTIQRIRLNITRNTVLVNSFGRNMCLCDFHVGMWVNAVFSSFMTRSIPPQTNAFFVMARRTAQPPVLPPINPGPPNTTTARIASVDPVNQLIVTGNRNNINSQARFIVNQATTITDRDGRLINLRALRPGQTVRIIHANFQTASIPPQTTAYHIQVL